MLRASKGWDGKLHAEIQGDGDARFLDCQTFIASATCCATAPREAEVASALRRIGPPPRKPVPCSPAGPKWRPPAAIRSPTTSEPGNGAIIDEPSGRGDDGRGARRWGERMALGPRRFTSPTARALARRGQIPRAAHGTARNVTACAEGRSWEMTEADAANRLMRLAKDFQGTTAYHDLEAPEISDAV